MATAESSVNFRPFLIPGLVLGGIAFLFCLVPCCQIVKALAFRNLEMVFEVTDAETGQPIPNARVDLLDWTRDPKFDVFTLVTDTTGTARFFREHNACDDTIGPFGRTVTHVDVGWASVNVFAKGYQPLEKLCLATLKYEYADGGREANFHPVTFHLQLRRLAER